MGRLQEQSGMIGVASIVAMMLAMSTDTVVGWHGVPEPVDRCYQASGIRHGMVWSDSEYIRPPYRICADASGIRINGVPWRATSSIDTSHAAADDGPQSTGQGRSETVRRVQRLASALRADGLIVGFARLPELMVPRGDREYRLCAALSSEQRFAAEIPIAKELTGHAALRKRLEQWIRSEHVSETVREELQQRMDGVSQAEHESRQQIAAVRRLEQFAYPLTVAGMLLGVLGLGHMLKWAGLQSPGRGVSEQSVRAAELALLLMAGMSLIDLAWTILAGQAGFMKEVNPLGAQLIHSPLSLAAFKIIATALGCGILYLWRRREEFQQATWWMCLICILLTFRWVVVDSLGV